MVAFMTAITFGITRDDAYPIDKTPTTQLLQLGALIS